MEDAELERLADLVLNRMELQKKRLWIEPESHYQDHLFLRHLRSSSEWAAKVVGAAVILSILAGALWLLSLGKSIK